ncbi:hypothetical protein ID866_10726 [Astraeus odoratus]|nr:hypothetical protein ID866_10726 [Astraeus odoratus]
MQIKHDYGCPAKKTVDWMGVPDKELETDLDETDLVGDAKAQEKCRRLCMAHDKEIQKAEKAHWEAEEQEWKHQAEEVEKCQKEEEERHQREAEAEQKWKDEQRKQATAAEARKWQQADSEAQASRSWVNASACIQSCTKAKECCGEHKKWAKKADNDNDNEIVILSGQKTKQQGGSEMLEEISNQWWGELIQAVSSCMDVANGHLEWIVSVLQSNRQKVQHHYMLMEGLVGQQQMLLSRLVKITSAAGSGGSQEVVKGSEEPKEPQGEESGGQEEIQGVPGGVLGDEPEDALGNEPENGAGAEDGAGEEAQKKDKGKGKERAI